MPRTAPGGRKPKRARDEWEVLATYHPGERGIRKLEKEWGARLVCVRYRYNAKRGKRRTTVEIVVGEAPWRHRHKDEVGIEIRSWEGELRKAVVEAGGRWDAERRLWWIGRTKVTKLALEDRIRRRPGSSTGEKR